MIMPKKSKKKIDLKRSKKIKNKTQIKKKSPKNADAKESEKKIIVTKLEDKGLSLVDRCRKQMSSSLLRLVDEDLYTSEIDKVSMDKEKFMTYHEAYTAVSERWPIKPVDYIVKFIKRRLLSKKKNHRFKIGDIGCGKEPILKLNLPNKAHVSSVDLVSAHKYIIEANMKDLPFQTESMDCLVYSLSLMAKSLGSILSEAKRVLKLGGSLIIVEVTSRFEGNENGFSRRLERIGFKQKTTIKLPPNSYFTFFHFTKIDSTDNYSSSVLDIKLKPCIYKAR